MAERETRSYDPSKVSVIIGGEIILGFVASKFITVSFAEAALTYTAGLSSGAISRNPNRQGSFMIELLQTSPSNDHLQQYISRARNDEDGWYFSVLILNNRGGEIASADSAWITKEPDLEFSKVAGSKKWSIQTGNLFLDLSANYLLTGG